MSSLGKNSIPSTQPFLFLFFFANGLSDFFKTLLVEVVEVHGWFYIALIGCALILTFHVPARGIYISRVRWIEKTRKIESKIIEGR